MHFDVQPQHMTHWDRPCAVESRCSPISCWWRLKETINTTSVERGVPGSSLGRAGACAGRLLGGHDDLVVGDFRWLVAKFVPTWRKRIEIMYTARCLCAYWCFSAAKGMMVPIPSGYGRPTAGFDRVGGDGGAPWAHDGKDVGGLRAVFRKELSNHGFWLTLKRM